MEITMDKKWLKRRKRLFQVLEVGTHYDHISRTYDYVNATAIILNLTASIMYTFGELRNQYGFWILLVEEITVAFFAVDYVLRLWTAKFLDEKLSESQAIMKYVFSFTGIIDIFSFLPYYLPFFFPSGAVAFRMVRIVRIFRLFRISAYHDSLSVIVEVIRGKKQQLISSVFLIITFMVAASLCMYSLEYQAQPEVFNNAFSGIWWAASTLLTVGYGDIYPITTMGKLFGISIAFLGVGMVAIPTGIISAGFVDRYMHIKKEMEYGYESDLNFIKIHIKEDDRWVGKRIADLGLSSGVIVAIIKRKDKVIIPRGDVVLEIGDRVVLGAKPMKEKEQINLKEMVLKQQNPWTGVRIQDLDISRHSIIVLVKRKNKALIPNGNMVLMEGDRVFLYTEKHLSDSNDIAI